jgi:uncharacterized phage-associated protein
MTEDASDPRSIANLMLDEGNRIGHRITNLALQKLLYFAHGIFLMEQKRPLVLGHFEAWQFGPVHPTAYQAFKAAGEQPITFRALRTDIVTGQRAEISSPDDPIVHRHVERIMQSYGRMTPGRLVDISHAKGAPWHFIVDKARTSLAFGLRISDDVILERFKHHKVSIGHFPVIGEPSEDTPFT